MRLIDADKLTNFLDESVPDSDVCISQYNADWIYSFIESAPTIDPVFHGVWIERWDSERCGEEYYDECYCSCSVCGYSEVGESKYQGKYCRECGALMDANNSTEQEM